MLFTGYEEFLYLLDCRNKMMLFAEYSEFVYLLDCRNKMMFFTGYTGICIFTKL